MANHFLYPQALELAKRGCLFQSDTHNLLRHIHGYWEYFTMNGAMQWMGVFWGEQSEFENSTRFWLIYDPAEFTAFQIADAYKKGVEHCQKSCAESVSLAEALQNLKLLQNLAELQLEQATKFMKS